MSDNCNKDLIKVDQDKDELPVYEEVVNNSDEIKDEDRTDHFYEDAKHYWEKIPATVDGMLGGFGFISDTDIKGSRIFLKSLFNLNDGPGKNRALDCGAGIGRITKHLLAPMFNEVDMVEQNPNFIMNSTSYIGKLDHKIGQKYTLGLQEFIPKNQYYDVIWCQWVLGHLKDDDLNRFLTLCQTGLTKNGVIVIKENVTSSDQVEMDTEDSSVTRPHYLLVKFFEETNLLIIKDVKQTNFPKGLYGVHMFALKQDTQNAVKTEEVLQEKLNQLKFN